MPNTLQAIFHLCKGRGRELTQQIQMPEVDFELCLELNQWSEANYLPCLFIGLGFLSCAMGSNHVDTSLFWEN